MSNLIKELDAEENIKVRVFEISTGFSVTMYDADAEMTLPIYKVFKEVNAALEYAKGLVK